MKKSRLGDFHSAIFAYGFVNTLSWRIILPQTHLRLGDLLCCQLNTLFSTLR